MITEMLSAGVYQPEQDLSYLPRISEQDGAVVIGPTEWGEAYIPTNIKSITEFNTKFGYSNTKTYVPQTVYNYMKYGNIMTIVRTMSETGYKHDEATCLSFTTQDGEQSIIATLHHAQGSTKTLGDIAKITLTITPDLYSTHVYTATVTVTDDITTLTESYEFSLVSTDSNYISKVFSTSSETTKLVYLYNIYNEKISELIDYVTTEGYTYTLDIFSFDLNFTNRPYENASTPWIISQYTNNLKEYEQLFKVKTFSQGNNVNKKVKISIENVKYSTEVPNSDYGTFNLLVRDFNDTDTRPIILEKYNALTLNPNDANYISRVIGDEYRTIVSNKVKVNGNYKNTSDYIYIEVNETIETGSMPKHLVPFGFERISVPYIDSTINKSFPITTFILEQDNAGLYDSRIYHGLDFNSTDNVAQLMQIATSNGTNTLNNINTTFNLGDCTIHINAPEDEGDSVAESDLLSARKFSIPLQGGFDGEDTALYKAVGSDITSSNLYGYDFSTAISNGTEMYKKAFIILSNKNSYDFNLILTPGTIYRLHTPVITSGINLCEGRGDVLYVFDIGTLDDSVSTAVNTTDSLDTNYGATYFPWGKILDTDINRFTWVPTSVFVPQAIAFNDKIGYEWNAPAGLNRAILDNVLDVRIPLDETDTDDLYVARVNPIASFKEGITVWGQKTLQQKASALDRINVRRLLIRLKKYTNSQVKYSVFEQNTSITRNGIINILSPYLDRIQQKGGLYGYKIVINEQTNTNEVIDRNQLKGIIAIKPTKTAEFIELTWSIVGTDFDFNNI